MLKRIVETSSNPGDLVLDCFAGSGTTLVAAEELGRQWIGVDIGDESIRVIQDRFINGTKPLGDYVSKKKKMDKPSLYCSPSLFFKSYAFLHFSIITIPFLYPLRYSLRRGSIFIFQRLSKL